MSTYEIDIGTDAAVIAVLTVRAGDPTTARRLATRRYWRWYAETAHTLRDFELHAMTAALWCMDGDRRAGLPTTWTGWEAKTRTRKTEICRHCDGSGDRGRTGVLRCMTCGGTGET